MTRSAMDQLNVGDHINVFVYNTATDDFEWIPTVVSKVCVCSDGGKFAHGGRCSVYAKVNGFTECLTPELTMRA